MSDIFNQRPLEKNEVYCGCCGSIVTSPQEPGVWEYLEKPGFLLTYPTEYPRQLWKRVTVIPHEEGMMCIPEGKTEPIWWPNNVTWRKVS